MLKMHRVINKLVKKENGIIWSFVFHGLKILKILKRKLGLNPGSDFETWITTILNDSGVKSLGDLKTLRTKLPEGLKNVVTGELLNDAEAKVAIITSDITTHTKTDFPRMAELYWDKPNDISPAKLVRSSMSIPFFFEPFTVKNIPNAGKDNDEKWYEYARYNGPVPSKVKFVDGGMLSNIPINVFHRKDGGSAHKTHFWG